jgi:hypothetical protein
VYLHVWVSLSWSGYPDTKQSWDGSCACHTALSAATRTSSGFREGPDWGDEFIMGTALHARWKICFLLISIFQGKHYRKRIRCRLQEHVADGFLSGASAQSPFLAGHQNDLRHRIIVGVGSHVAAGTVAASA